MSPQCTGLIMTDTPLIDELQSSPRLSVLPIPNSRLLQTGNKLLFLVLGPLKVFFQTYWLWQTLAYRATASEWMLVQNPPSIPVLMMAVVVCFLRGTKLVIDWHNFGYSILALKLGENHPLVFVAFLYELSLAGFATAHLVVTDAMTRVLKTRLSAANTIMTLHDRPAALFQPMNDSQRLAFLQRYTLLAEHYDSIAQGKARLLVSSTSWTPDEDFSVLLESLQTYSSINNDRLPHLIVVITGKGPLQAQYRLKIQGMQKEGKLTKASIHTDWLSFEDYASLLGSSDLGISLHTSSSGVDLPMKVVDMFGAGLPVLGWNAFAAWPELVTEMVDGKGFGSSDELTTALVEVFEPGNNILGRLKKGALEQCSRRWDDEWQPIAGKLFGLVD